MNEQSVESPELPEQRTTPMPASCAVKLPVFEGPLDLLLHLIRTNEVDIADIPISQISDQYLSYLDLMEMLDIDVASDYLVMAATLAYIKSRMLLPPDPDADEDEEGGDPRAELARRLAEYAVFKDMANELGGRPLLGRDVFRGTPDVSDIPSPEPVLDVSLWKLLEAMQRVLKNLPDEDSVHHVLRETLTVQDRMIHVMDLVAGNPAGLLFEELLTGAVVTRQRVVLTFLAILELTRIRALSIFQQLIDGQPEGPVCVRAAVTEDDDGGDAGTAGDAGTGTSDTQEAP